MRQFAFLPTLVTPFDVRRTRKRVPAVLIDSAPLVCLCLNSEWASHVSGVIERLLYEDVWLGTDEEIDFAIHEIERFLATMSCFDCGGNDPPPQYRYNEFGRLEKSTDGGQTWETADQEDPRFNSPIFPPLPPDTPDATRCRAAENAKIAIHDMVDQFIAEGATWSGIAGATAALLALLAIFITLGTATPAVVALAAAILSAGVTAIDAAFTPDVYTTLRCILFCACKDDGSFDAAAWEQIKNDVNVQFTGIVHSILTRQLDALGPAGLTNAGRTDISGPVSCNDCTDCPGEWCYEFDFVTGGAYDFIPLSPPVGGGVYASGGWTPTDEINTNNDPDTGQRVISIHRAFTQTLVTRAVMTYDLTLGNWDTNTATATATMADQVGTIAQVNRSASVSGSDLILEWNGGRNMSDIILFVRSSRDITSPFTYGGDCRLKRLRLEGTGVNPFGTSNCTQI